MGQEAADRRTDDEAHAPGAPIRPKVAARFSGGVTSAM
jgi:hypothetical protein